MDDFCLSRLPDGGMEGRQKECLILLTTKLEKGKESITSYQYSQHELMNSKEQRKGLVTWLARHAACRLQPFTQQINVAAPSCFKHKVILCRYRYVLTIALDWLWLPYIKSQLGFHQLDAEFEGATFVDIVFLGGRLTNQTDSFCLACAAKHNLNIAFSKLTRSLRLTCAPRSALSIKIRLGAYWNHKSCLS